MTRTLQKRYVVVTGDLKSSRKLKDRVGVQEELKSALRIVNRRFDDAIPAKFMVIGGDSFQGMLSSPKYLFDIYFAFFENISHQFYLGIGVGNISTRLSENVGEIDGEAFHKASEALESAKKENMWITFKSEWEIDDIVTCLLNFMADVMWNWTKRQREIVTYYRKVKNEKGRITLEEVARSIGIKKQTLSKILKRSKYKLLKEAEDTFADFIIRNWLTEQNKPKMAVEGW
ncbi:SatD [Methanophagales archaeon]|nr:MAG: SatD [Methanophagales archaeon]